MLPCFNVMIPILQILSHVKEYRIINTIYLTKSAYRHSPRRISKIRRYSRITSVRKERSPDLKRYNESLRNQVREKIRLLKPVKQINANNLYSHTGAFALFDTFVHSKISVLFGYPGGAILPLYDELFFWENKKLIKHYLVRHEQAATHAADGYSRSSGKIGICFATSGPGATNLVTGIATAYLDSVPMIIITGQVGSEFLGSDAFQEIDIYGITLSLVKHSFVVLEARLLPQMIAEAIYISRNGRPGPVLIDIPKNIGLEKIKKYIPCYEINVHKVLGWRYNFKNQRTQVRLALRKFSEASNPVFYVGGGIKSSNASYELHVIAERYKIPVTTTLMGKGCFNENSPLCLGMLGMHGTAYANFCVGSCDLLIAIGARFDDRVTGKLDEFACNATIIHIDFDSSEIGKNKDVDVSITGDIKTILKEFLLIMKRPTNRWTKDAFRHEFKDWYKQMIRWKWKFPMRPIPSDPSKLPKTTNNVLLPQSVLRTIKDIKPRAIITTDVGQHQMWAAQYLKCNRRKWLSSAGLGTMGFGVPAAIGAAIANPRKDIICITGDSSFQMNLQELGTIAKYNLRIKIIIINNHWQGMVRQWQETFYGGRYSQSNMSEGSPNFKLLADSYGIKSIYTEKQTDIWTTLRDSLWCNNPFLVECNVLDKENCYPMVDPAKGNTEMFLSRELSTTKDGLIVENDETKKRKEEERKDNGKKRERRIFY
uniref:Acetolactate synthase n=1 Tax=Phaeophyceae sp. TaxID=2249243 RepID=A0A8E5FAQ3_9PHAE|nr:acetolactate synthase large subunit [Phaeophyceae sp.]